MPAHSAFDHEPIHADTSRPRKSPLEYFLDSVFESLTGSDIAWVSENGPIRSAAKELAEEVHTGVRVQAIDKLAAAIATAFEARFRSGAARGLNPIKEIGLLPALFLSTAAEYHSDMNDIHKVHRQLVVDYEDAIRDFEKTRIEYGRELDHSQNQAKKNLTYFTRLKKNHVALKTNSEDQRNAHQATINSLTDRLQEEVQKCRKLEAENAHLRQQVEGFQSMKRNRWIPHRRSNSPSDAHAQPNF